MDKRLDILLLERGLAESRARAQWLIRQGYVRCAGQCCRKPGRQYGSDVPISIEGALPYVSRGGLKLAHALDVFGLSVRDRLVLDVGASTGGFSDCLLQRGVRRVYAVDVGTGQLHRSLRGHSRLVSLEQVDIRELDELPGAGLVDLAVVDVSFISLRLVLPAVLRFLQTGGQVVALIKPQFEAGPEAVSRRGRVWRSEDHRRVLREVLEFSQDLGLLVVGLCRAPADTDRANCEYLVHLRRAGEAVSLPELICSAMRDADERFA
ncbi:MAG: TlyA family RNA methyltransferase [Chloroflexia bacterium]|nr:TlyA family RNA methyltransferase [Chloroflexia bacterium]